jgi:streptogramin lyase
MDLLQAVEGRIMQERAKASRLSTFITTITPPPATLIRNPEKEGHQQPPFALDRREGAICKQRSCTMKLLRIPGSMFILLLSFLALSLSTSVPLAWAAVGTITEFPLPTAGSGPAHITLGPDGNLWFTEAGGNKIGRITPSGAITEFTVPTAGSGPLGITAGPDGNLWFTEEFRGKIGRITPSGAITEFTVPTFGNLFDITAGRDGNLWFDEGPVNKIGRITTGGAITEFPIPTAFSFPFGIASGRGDKVWFTELAGNNIGRISTR